MCLSKLLGSLFVLLLKSNGVSRSMGPELFRGLSFLACEGVGLVGVGWGRVAIMKLKNCWVISIFS